VRALGLDGYSKGWVAVLLDGDRQEISFHPDVAEALSRPFNRAGIDIPIGMTDNGERVCDLLARAKLRPHTSRVFTGARRWLWREFDDPASPTGRLVVADRSACRASSGISAGK
jgi:predicted RNase H-like nuclease